MPQPGFAKHDHRRCIATALAEAEAHCVREKAHLTPVRRRVLEILLEDHRAMGAYDVLARLQAEGHSAQPPVAYRALDFLVSHGFVHRIEGHNAYIACAQPGTAHDPAFMICRNCAAVAETGAAPADQALDQTARDLGFAIEKRVLEVEGLCPACAAGPRK